jgi:hypothetical protein
VDFTPGAVLGAATVVERARPFARARAGLPHVADLGGFASVASRVRMRPAAGARPARKQSALQKYVLAQLVSSPFRTEPLLPKPRPRPVEVAV